MSVFVANANRPQSDYLAARHATQGWRRGASGIAPGLGHRRRDALDTGTPARRYVTLQAPLILSPMRARTYVGGYHPRHRHPDMMIPSLPLRAQLAGIPGGRSRRITAAAGQRRARRRAPRQPGCPICQAQLDGDWAGGRCRRSGGCRRPDGPCRGGGRSRAARAAAPVEPRGALQFLRPQLHPPRAPGLSAGQPPVTPVPAPLTLPVPEKGPVKRLQRHL